MFKSKEYKKINDNMRRKITSDIGDKRGRDNINNLQKTLNEKR